MKQIAINKLSLEQAKTELAQLIDDIQSNDKLYYQLDKPQISDANYDQLRQRLTAIEQKFPALKTHQSPSQTIGEHLSEGFKKIAHLSPMLSLENAMNETDMIAFFERCNRFLTLDEMHEITVIAEPKIDGLSCNLIYNDGQLVSAATRGNGSIGEEITANIMTISDIPQILLGDRPQGVLEIRGEIYITKSDFQKLNDHRLRNEETPFANPRNAAAGSVRQLDSTVTASRSLRFFAYGFGVHPFDHLKTHAERLNLLRDWEFKVNPLITECATRDKAYSYHNKLEVNRANLDFDIDGTVLKINDLEIENRLGTLTRTPRFSIALKFSPTQAITTLKDIVIQVGRTGVLTPVAILEPVTVGGVVVQRATLHNQDEIERKNVNVGDQVIIQRAGDVIPQIVRTIKNSSEAHHTTFIMPMHCPICHSEVIQPLGQVAYRCTGGLICPAQAELRLRHFVSKYAFDIDNMGAQTINSFYKHGLIKTPVDIFRLEEINATLDVPLTKWDGWGEKSVYKLFQSINDRKKISFDRFIYALGIPQIGEVMAKQLALRYKSYEEWVDQMNRALQDPESQAYNNLATIDGIGQMITQDLLAFFNQPLNQKLLDQLVGNNKGDGLIKIIPYHIEKTNIQSHILYDKKIVFTGSLQTLSRAEVKHQAEKFGAKVTSSITSNTDYLVIGDKPGSKLKHAKLLNIKILTEDDWQSIIKQA